MMHFSNGNAAHARLRALCAATAVAVLAGCGGGGGGTAAPDPTNVGSSGASNLPDPRSVANPDGSTFLIMLKTEDGAGRTRYAEFGTGFAIRDDLLATNSHVTQGVLDSARSLARNGARLTGVSAFQASTGVEYPLLEALVHPSYTGDSRSADVGLFVARDPLPNRLVLASSDEASRIAAGEQVQVNGFPGDVFEQIVADGFEPGLTVPQASRFTGNIQALRSFDERKLVNANTLDMFEYSMDTSGGTSGSPVLRDGTVIGVHNSGNYQLTFRPGPNNTVIIDRDATGTASFGIHVKHLHALIREYESGVLAAERRFRLPPPNELVAAAPGQGVSVSSSADLDGTVSNPDNPSVAHTLELTIAPDLTVSGTSRWPANPSLGLAARSFELSGSVNPNGQVEITDNTPEVIAGFRRGVYVGTFNPAAARIDGQYFEYDQPNDDLIYFGDWTAGAR